MKKLIIPVLALVLASCAKEQFSESQVAQPGQELTITATSGDPDTRTERASDGSVLWSPGDQISLFYGSGTDGGSCFTSQNTETAKVANFTGTIGVITGGNDVSVEDTYFWATYPYNATASCDGASVTTVLSSEQVATPDTFADDLFPSIGRSQGLNMAFYNICGGLKFTVSEEGIKSVTLKGNNGEQIAGRITVGFEETGLPKIRSISDGSDSIVLSAPEGEAFEVSRAYYIVLVPTVFENGFTLTFNKGYSTAVYNRTKETPIRRSSFGSLKTPDKDLEWQYDPDAPLVSITTITDYTIEGNPAIKYQYVSGLYKQVAGTATGFDYEEEGAYTVRAKNSASDLMSGGNAVPFNIGAMKTVEYSIFPAVYDLKQSALYGLSCADRNFASNTDAAAAWSASPSYPIMELSEGNYSLTFKIVDPDKLKGVTNTLSEASIVRLYALDKKNNQESVYSDYAIVSPEASVFNHLAFTGDYPGKAANTVPSLGNSLLFDSAAEAAENPASVRVQYNGYYDGFPLDFIGVQIGEDSFVTPISDIQRLYPSLEMKYEVIDYTLGSNATSENAYGIIERGGSKFYPAFAKASAYSGYSSEKITSDNVGYGVSAIGRRPIVLATLVNTSDNNKILLAGYFKILIEDSSSTTSSPSGGVMANFVLKNFYEPLAYNCGTTQLQTYWYDMSYQLLGNCLNLTYAAFRKNYEWDGNTYEKKASGAFVATQDYGTIEYLRDNAANADETNSALNDIFVLSVSRTQADNVGIGRPKTLYARLSGNSGDVFAGLSFTVGDYPALKLTGKNPAYWYDDLNFNYSADAGTDLGMATVRSSVRTPMVWKRGGSYNSYPVTVFDVVLNDNWQASGYGSNGPRIVYANGNSAYNVSYRYRFSEDNKNITVNGKKWTRANDGTLRWNGTDALYITSDGSLSFVCNSTTKSLINWATNPRDKALDPSITENLLYCNVDIVMSISGTSPGEYCDVAVEQMRVRIMRPLTLSFDPGDYYLTEGSTIEFGNCFRITDWKNTAVLSYDSSLGAYKKAFTPAGTNESTCTIDWYDYYGVTQMTVYIDSIETDQTGSYKLLRDVNTSALVGLMSPSDPNNILTNNVVINDMTSLAGWKLFYSTPTSSAKDYHLRCRVSMQYAWGTIEKTIVIPVYGYDHM